MSTLLDLPFQLGEPRESDGLVVTPIFPTADPVCDYLALDEALIGGLTVSEVSREGSVGELRVRNPLGTAALLYDGEELAGAKQNRILNLTVLVAAGAELTVPVSCVERGRWDRQGPQFRSAGHISYPELRRVKAQMLKADATRLGAAQQAVWERRRPAAARLRRGLADRCRGRRGGRRRAADRPGRRAAAAGARPVRRRGGHWRALVRRLGLPAGRLRPALPEAAARLRLRRRRRVRQARRRRADRRAAGRRRTRGAAARPGWATTCGWRARA